MFTGLMIGIFLGAAATWLGFFFGRQPWLFLWTTEDGISPAESHTIFSARIRPDRKDYEAIERHERLPYTRQALSVLIATD